MSGTSAFRSTGLAGLLAGLVLALVATLPASVHAQDQAGRSVFTFLDTEGRSVRVGESVSGQLTTADALAGGGQRVQAWALDGMEAGDRILVDLESDDFDAYLFLVGGGLGVGLRDDDGGSGLDSRICFEAETAGAYRLIAASLGGGTGSFTLTVADYSDGECDNLEVTDESPDYSELPFDDRFIGVDEEVTDYLDDTYRIFGAPVEAWALQGTAGTTVTIDVRSRAFDAQLTVLGPGLGDEPLWDDDSAGRCDARLEVTLSSNAIYTIVVESYGQTGEYTLEVTTDPGPVDPAGCTGTGGGGPTGGPMPFEGTGLGSVIFSSVEPEGSIPADGLLAGTVTGREARVADRWVQPWTFQAVAGDRIAVSLESDDFDTYLYLMGPDFPDALYNDDTDGLDSRICYQVDTGGTFTAFASAYSGDAMEEGSGFRLRVSRGDDADALCGEAYYMSPGASQALEAEEMARLPMMGDLPFDGTVDGEMTGDEVSLSFTSRPVQGWTLIGSAGERVSITLRSEDFDPYLYFSGPGFPAPLSDDDGAEGVNSRICVDLQEAGEYMVLAGAFGSSSPGDAFQLSVARGTDAMQECEGEFDLTPAEEAAASAAQAAEVLELDTDGRVLGPETSVNGYLDASQQLPGTGDWIQAWELLADPGTEVHIYLESPDFDTYLRAVASDMPQVDNDDFDGSLNSSLTVRVPASGRVLVLAGSYSGQVEGGYLLTTSRSPRVPAFSDEGLDSGFEDMIDLPDNPALSHDGILPVGVEISGYLSGGEALRIADQPAQAFQVEVEPGATVIFEVVSDDFDAYMYVAGPGLDEGLADDDSAGGLNARIVVREAVGGVYTVFARALSSNSSGAFQVRTIRRIE